jgi:MFS transporter, DHA1 family, multidrug resistance protein
MLKQSGPWVVRYEPVLLMGLHITAIFLAWHFVIPVLPRFALDFGVSTAEVGMLISALTLARVFFNFPAGAMSERIGRRAVLIAGGVIVGLASIVCGLVQEYWQLLAARFVTGIGGAMCVTVYMTVMADLSTAATRARLMSISEGVVSIGLFIGPGLGGLIADWLGLRVPFIVIGVGIVLSTVLVVLRLPETRGWNADPHPAGAPKHISPWAGLKIMMSDRNYLMINLVGLAAFMTRFGVLFLLLPIIGNQRFGLTPGHYGLMASGIALAAVPLLPVSANLADRVGRKAVIVPSTIMSGLAIMAFGLAPTREWFFAAAAFYAVAAGINGPVPGAYLADISPSHLRGISMGAYRTFGDVAGFVGPTLLGFMALAVGDGLVVVVDGALLVAAALVFMAFAGETLPARQRVAAAPAGS